MGGRAGELHGHVLLKHLLVVNGRHGDKAWALTWEDQREDEAVKDKEGSGREAQRCCVCVSVCARMQGGKGRDRTGEHRERWLFTGRVRRGWVASLFPPASFLFPWYLPGWLQGPMGLSLTE